MYPGKFFVEVGDIRNYFQVAKVIEKASSVFHFAAQVAVTTSLVDPITDFEINAKGTFYSQSTSDSLCEYHRDFECSGSNPEFANQTLYYFHIHQ